MSKDLDYLMILMFVALNWTIKFTPRDMLTTETFPSDSFSGCQLTRRHPGEKAVAGVQ
jgi:hypothetical protein